MKKKITNNSTNNSTKSMIIFDAVWLGWCVWYGIMASICSMVKTFNSKNTELECYIPTVKEVIDFINSFSIITNIFVSLIFVLFIGFICVIAGKRTKQKYLKKASIMAFLTGLCYLTFGYIVKIVVYVIDKIIDFVIGLSDLVIKYNIKVNFIPIFLIICVGISIFFFNYVYENESCSSLSKK